MKKLSALLLATLMLLGGTTVFAQQQTINIGSAPNDGTGDTLRAMGGKVNSNFTELYGKFPVSIANGGTGVASATDDATLVGNGTTFQLKTIPSCTDTAGNHLNYNIGTNVFSCGTSTSVTGAALTKTDDTNVTLTLGGSPTTALVNASSLTLGWTGQLSAARGGTGLSTVTDDTILVANGTTWQSKAVPDCTDASGNHLNYTAGTNVFSCGTSKSTAVLTTDVSGILPVANGGLNLSAATDDAVPTGNGTTWQAKTLPSCADSGGNHLNYDTSTNTWSCGTSGDGAGTNPFTTYSFNDDFVAWTVIGAGSISAGTPYIGPWVMVGNGTASGNSGEVQASGHPGVMTLSTGSTTTGWTGGYHSSGSNGKAILLQASNQLTIDCIINIPTLPDATQTWSFSCGGIDSNDGSGFSNGILGQVIWNGSAVRWNLQTKDQSGSTSNSAASTGPSAATWYHMKITATTALVTLLIDGVSVATVATAANIPNGHGFSEYWEVRKSAGSTNRTLSFDYYGSTFPLPATR